MVPINLNLIPRGEMKVRTHKQTEGKKFLSGISGKIIPIWFMKGKKTTPLISRGLSVTSREKKETPLKKRIWERTPIFLATNEIEKRERKETLLGSLTAVGRA